MRQCWVLWSIEYDKTGTEYEFYDYMRESRRLILSLNFNLHLLNYGKSTKFAATILDAVRQCWVLWSTEYDETGTEYEFYD